MSWIKTEDELPEPGKYVLARHNRGTWFDSQDQDNVNCVVVKLVRGLSKEDREKIKLGLLPEQYYDAYDSLSGHHKAKRSNSFSGDDEDGNNLKPYGWHEFGPDHFFGQEITHWQPIEKL